METTEIVSRSEKFTKALTANSQATEYASPLFPNPFDIRSTEPVGDGIFVAGAGGAFAPTSITLLPFADGPSDARFTMRLFGWTHNISTDPAMVVWIPFLLGEYLCKTCLRHGPIRDRDPSNVRVLRDSERMCDTIQQTLGFQSMVSSPGNNLIAVVKAPLWGCRKFQFDFAQVDPNITMNCYWLKSS